MTDPNAPHSTSTDEPPTAKRGILVALGATLLALVVVLGALATAQDGEPDPAFTDLSIDDATRATTLFEIVNAAPYTDWAFEPGVPEGYYVGQEPHGLILRSYVDETAMADIGSGAEAFSAGALIVKENHAPGDIDTASMEPQSPVENFDGDLGSLTYMVKIPGYNAEAGDWFWAKIQPDGTIDAAGKPAGCIGCHDQVSDNDWVFNAAPSGD